MSLGSYFGASSTTPRITDATKWIELHGSQRLVTARQIMSIAVPMLNLTDGKASGSQLFWSQLIVPLSNAVQQMIDQESFASEEERHHQVTAVASIFQLMAKLSESIGEGPAGKERLSQWIALHELASTFLLDRHKDCVDLSKCMASLSALFACSASPAAEELKARISTLLSQWMSVLETSSTSSSAAQHGDRKAPIVMQLCQLLTAKPGNNPHALLLLRLLLQLAPSAISNGSIKDICFLTQGVSKVRQMYPRDVSYQSLRSIMDVMRPKLFLLTEGSQGALFRHLECSILLTQLSRWDEQPFSESATPLLLTNDVVELLCSRFILYLPSVKMPQLLPMLLALVRVVKLRSTSEKQRSQLDFKGYANHFMEREIELVREGGVTAVEAVSSLKLYHRLGVDAEPLLLSAEKLVANFLLESSNEAIASSFSAFVKGMDLFSSRGAAARSEETQRMTEHVLSSLRLRAPTLLAEVSSAEEFISVVLTVFSEPAQRVESDEERTTESSAVLPPQHHQAISEAFFSRVGHFMSDCTASQLCALALCVSVMSTYNQEAAQRTMKALLSQLLPLQPNLADLKKVLDGCSRMSYTEEAETVVPLMVVAIQKAGEPNVNFSTVMAVTQFLRSACRYLSTAGSSSFSQQSVIVAEAVLKKVNAVKVSLEMEGTHSHSLTIPTLAVLAFSLSRIFQPASLGLLLSPRGGAEEGVQRDDEADDKGVGKVETEALQPTFQWIGDVLTSLLTKTDSAGVVVEPKFLVMLIQAFSSVGCEHNAFLYAALEALSLGAALVEPLELSLVLNALVQQGVWNAHAIDMLAMKAKGKISSCSLSQCRAILSALQRSRFLSPHVHFVGSPQRQTLRIQHGDGRTTKSNESLEALAIAVVQRLHDISATRSRRQRLARTSSLQDVVSAMRMVAFFQYPPQPLSNRFVLLTLNVFLVSALKCFQSNKNVEQETLRDLLSTAVHLLKSILKLSRFKQQKAASRCVTDSLFLLRRRFSVNAWNNAAPPRSLAELCANVQIHEGLYGVKRSKAPQLRQLYHWLTSGWSSSCASHPLDIFNDLQPLFSPGALLSIPADALTIDGFLTVLEANAQRDSHHLPSALLVAEGVNYLLLHQIPSAVQARLQALGRLVLTKCLRDVGELKSTNAATLFCGTALTCLPQNAATTAASLTTLRDHLLASPLTISSAVTALLGVAHRTASLGGELEAEFESLAIITMQRLLLLCGRHDIGVQANLQMYRLLTAGNGVWTSIFLSPKLSVDPAMRTAAGDLLSRILLVLARLVSSEEGPALSRQHLSTIRSHVLRSLPSSLQKVEHDAPSTQSETFRKFEVILRLCDALQQ